MHRTKNTRLLIVLTILTGILFTISCDGPGQTPEAVPPDSSQPEEVSLDSSQPEAVPPDSSQPEEVSLDSSQSEEVLPDSSQPEEVSPTPSPSDQFKPTIAFFLLDVSTSIQNLCESQFQEWRTKIPEFFITYANAYHYNEFDRNEEFKIGWATFPSDQLPLAVELKNLNQFNNYSGWTDELNRELETYRNGLEFASSLNEVVTQLSDPEYSGYQKIIFVISDTYLSYKPDPGQTSSEKDEIERVITGFPEDWRLHIVQLPCMKSDGGYEYPANFKDDIVFWRELQFGTEQYNIPINVYLLDRNSLITVGDVFTNLFRGNDHVLKSLLPWETVDGRYGWGWIAGQNITLQDGRPAQLEIDGYTNRFDITAIAVGDAPGFELHRQDYRGFSLVTGSDSDTAARFLYKYSDGQPAQDECDHYEWEFKGQSLPESAVGIFWWQAEYQPPQLTFTVSPSTTLHNPTIFNVEARLSGEVNYPSCYQGRLKIDGEIYGKAQGEIELRSINELSWLEIPYDPSKTPREFQVVVEIVRVNQITNAQNLVFVSNSTNVQANFSPLLSMDSPPEIEQQCDSCIVFSITFDFATRYHLGRDVKPEVYLLTGKTRSEQTAADCNKEKFNNDGKVPAHGDDFELNGYPQLYAYPYAIKEIVVGADKLQTTIRIHIPKSWQDYCAYTHLFLQWPNAARQDSWHNVDCDLNSGTCRKSEFDVVNN